jgi:hypothetical protein
MPLSLDYLADLQDEDLVDLYESIREKRTEIAKDLRMVEGALLGRMDERNGDAVYSGNVVVERTVTRSYNWDIAELQRNVMPHIPRAQWDALVHEYAPLPPKPTYKVETNRLLTLAKKRGTEDEVAKAILRAAVVDEQPKLVFKEIGA